MESDANYSNLYFKNIRYNDNNSIIQSNSVLMRLRSAPTSLLESYIDEKSTTDDDRLSFSSSRLCSPDDANEMYASGNKNVINRFAAARSQLPPQYPRPSVNQLGPLIMDKEEYRGASSMSVDHHQGKLGNYSLMKQNTSPAGWFTNLNSHDGFRYASWNDFEDNPTTSGIKREINMDQKLYSNSAPQKVENNDEPQILSHHLSLPATKAEKILQLQDTVPCKIRAKRGCATHPRSIAERVRRTRISERMRKLQELVPNMDKQTNTADMLDLAVEYIKGLQRQYKMLSDSRANCKCSASEMVVSNHTH